MTTLILVPGFWLDASSWSEVTPPLEAAGHDVRPLTLPGLESPDADRSSIGLADHVAAVVAEIDGADQQVVLVGHSGAGTVVHAAVDQRPDRVSRVIYVDSGPTPAGLGTNEEVPDENGEVPLPGWDDFDGELTDFTDEQLEEFRARAIPHPRGGAKDAQVLSDERRHDVPITLISTTMTTQQIEEWTAQGVPYFAELPHIKDVTVVELPTSHWPQFTKPTELSRAILDAA
ncbi:MAG: alpha/beta fold hydrolase [Aeromicrobium sp.]